MSSGRHLAGLLVIIGLMLGHVPLMAQVTEADDVERITHLAKLTIDEMRSRIASANKLRGEEREIALDNIMTEVVAPIIRNESTVARFYAPHWPQIQAQGLTEKARAAGLALLKDNYLFVLERSGKAKVELKKVTVKGREAQAFFRIHTRKRVPVTVELRMNETEAWRVHDVIFIRRSIREDVREEMHECIEELGLEGAFDAILAEG